MYDILGLKSPLWNKTATKFQVWRWHTGPGAGTLDRARSCPVWMLLPSLPYFSRQRAVRTRGRVPPCRGAPVTRAVVPGRLPCRREGVGSVSRQGPTPLEGGRRRWRLLRRPGRTKRGQAGRALGVGTGPGKQRVLAPRGANPALARESDGLLLPRRRGSVGVGRWREGGLRFNPLSRFRDCHDVWRDGTLLGPRRQGGICSGRPKGAAGRAPRIRRTAVRSLLPAARGEPRPRQRRPILALTSPDRRYIFLIRWQLNEEWCRTLRM